MDNESVLAETLKLTLKQTTNTNVFQRALLESYLKCFSIENLYTLIYTQGP